MILGFEMAAMAVTISLALLVRNRPRARIFRTCYLLLRRIAQRRTWAIFLLGLLSFSINALVGQLNPILPRVHDEFSYLLAADTFLHGRLTNPTHAQWQHFESFHVIHEPSYQAKFPPAFGVMLALGRCLGGPTVGLWLTLSLACASVCWMLQAWLRPFWAFLGGLLLATHLGIILWWGQTYWAAGGLAMLGGALVYGALRRVIAKPSARQTLLFGAGLLVLANSRPFEGLVVSLPAIATICIWLVRQRTHGISQVVRHYLLPGLISVVVIMGSLAYYNWRVTGDAFRFPYQVHEETYASAPLFVSQRERPSPAYRHAVIRDFQQNWSLMEHRAQQVPGRWFRTNFRKLLQLWVFFLRPALLVALFALPWVLRNRWMQLAALAVAFELIAILSETFLNPHYFAPAVGLMTLLVTRSLQQLRIVRWSGRPFGRILFRGIVITLLVTLGIGLTEFVRKPLSQRDITYLKAVERSEMVQRLINQGGKHLVLVKYAKNHNFFFEWIYNDADIDQSPIVWARPMSPEKEKELLEYFRDRQVWVLFPDATPAQLAPYPQS